LAFPKFSKPQGSVYFAIRGKKYCWSYFAI